VAGTSVVIEEFIDGQELSYLVFTDGISYSLMPAAQDHKRANDNDEGLNTGGMGAYAPAPLATDVLTKKVEETIVKKVIAAMRSENLDYKGVLYIGVIMNVGAPFVLEFNCRFGDPETQVVLPLLETDLSDICNAILNKKLSEIEIKWKKEFAVCVVLASGGYPGKFEKGFEISGLDNFESIYGAESVVFHAGTALAQVPENKETILLTLSESLTAAAQSASQKYITSGGRVLTVTSLGADIKSAIDKVYLKAGLISFKNMHYRKDIAQKALRGLNGK
ncbi:MAG: hypothetical protein LBQ47_04440, partial [Endomicrobium sp.]|nr:hypothetical protein [Endomicrobium sp.]